MEFWWIPVYSSKKPSNGAYIMWFLYLFVAIVLVAAYFLFTPPQQQQTTQSPLGLEDFQIPDVSEGKSVPYVYGTVKLAGNCLYYGNLTAVELMACQSGKGGGGK